MPGSCQLVVIYGAPFSGKSSLAWQLARGMPGKTAVISTDQLLSGAIAVPDRDAEAELEMVHIQLRLLTANYLKNRYHVVVEGPFLFEREGHLIDYEGEIGQLVALMRQLVSTTLIVKLEVAAEVTAQRATGHGRQDELDAALRISRAYQGRYPEHALHLDSSEQPLPDLAREIHRRLDIGR